MQNMCPASWFYLTGHCYVRSMFVKHICLKKFVVVAVVCLLVLAVVFFNWYKSE